MYTSANRSHGLFRNHPQVSAFKLRSGDAVNVPFHVYEGDATQIFGTADLARLQTLAAESGYHAVETSKGRGIAALWLMDYRDSSAGPYREVIFAIAVSGQRRVWKQRNAYTALAPTLDRGGRLMTVRLLLPADNPTAIAYGREVNGFDKRPASEMDFSHHPTSDEFAVYEGGDLAFKAQVRRGRAFEQVQGAAALVSNVGLGTVIRSLATSVQSIKAVTTLPGFRDQVTENLIITKPRFAIWRKGSQLELGTSDFGRLLAGADFQPTVALHDRNIQGVTKVPEPTP